MPINGPKDDAQAMTRSELLQRAEQLEGAGDREQAIEIYDELVALDRRDSMALLKIGDLRLKLKHYSEAISAYGRAADRYSHGGVHDKALAVYTQMRALIRRRAKHLEPRYADLPLRLAETHAALGHMTEAAKIFSEVVGMLVADGQAREALTVADRMLALDQRNPTAHLLRADCHAKLGEIDKAVACAGAAAESLVSESKLDEAIAVLERLLEYWPDPAYARVAARVYLARGKANDAIAAIQKLQICFAADPSDVSTLELLASAFDDIDQLERSNRVLEEAAKAAQNAGRIEDYERLARKLLARDRDNSVARAFADHLSASAAERVQETDDDAAWGMRQLEEEITSVVSRQRLLREAQMSRDAIDSGLLSLEEEITDVLGAKGLARSQSVDEDALWRADALAGTGCFDEARAILSGQDQDHPLVRDVSQRVDELAQIACESEAEGSLPSLFPVAFGGASPALAQELAPPGTDEAPSEAVAVVEGAPPLPPRRPRRRAALSGAITRKPRRGRR